MYTVSVDFGLLRTTCMCNSIGDYMLIYIYTLIISNHFVGIDVLSLETSSFPAFSYLYDQALTP
jgi:hypothetical protein